jgi:hypothetical protein
MYNQDFISKHSRGTKLNGPVSFWSGTSFAAVIAPAFWSGTIKASGFFCNLQPSFPSGRRLLPNAKQVILIH